MDLPRNSSSRSPAFDSTPSTSISSSPTEAGSTDLCQGEADAGRAREAGSAAGQQQDTKASEELEHDFLLFGGRRPRQDELPECMLGTLETIPGTNLYRNQTGYLHDTPAGPSAVPRPESDP